MDNISQVALTCNGVYFITLINVQNFTHYFDKCSKFHKYQLLFFNVPNCQLCRNTKNISSDQLCLRHHLYSQVGH